MNLSVLTSTDARANVQQVVRADGSPLLAAPLPRDGSPASAEHDEVITLEGDPADRVFVVTRGTVRLCKVLADGRRAIVGFLHVGDLIGYSGDPTYRMTAEAVSDVQLRWWPRTTFNSRAIASTDLQRWLARAVERDLARALDHMLLLGRKTAAERVATLLVELMRRQAGRGELELPMSRLDMADYLGLTLETVSRVFSHLKQAKVIALPRPQTVRVLSVPALARWAGDTNAYGEIDHHARAA
jgi:CRP-like cAMP-binding protein